MTFVRRWCCCAVGRPLRPPYAAGYCPGGRRTGGGTLNRQNTQGGCWLDGWKSLIWHIDDYVTLGLERTHLDNEVI